MEKQKEITDKSGYITSKISLKKNLVLTFKILKQVKFSFFHVGIWSLISSIAELIGVVIIFSYVFSFLDQNNNLANENWQVVFTFLESITNENVFIFSLLILITILGKSFIGITSNYYSSRECFAAQEKIAVLLTKRFINTYNTNNQNVSVGDAVGRIFNENERFINAGVAVITKLWAELFTTFLLLTLLLYSQTAATLTLIFVFVLISVVYLIFTNNVMNRLGVDIAKYTSDIIGSITNVILGIDEIQQLDKDDFFLNKIKQTSIGFKKVNSLRVALSFLTRYFIEFGLMLFLVILTVINEMEYFDKFDNTNIGSLALFGVVGLRLLPAVSTMVTGISSLIWASHSTQLIYTNLFTDMSPVSNNNTSSQNFNIFNSLSIYKDQKKISVQIKNGEIFYISSEPILTNINITLEIGSIISIIGSSGSGKSSLGKLFSGLMPIGKGDILINNKYISNKDELMKIFHYVPQKPFVFKGNIYENITFQELENANSIMKNEVRKSLIKAGLNDNKWLDPTFKIFDAGKNLSGGEAQRIALARVLYKDPEILILDEFTSSIDQDTEKSILQNLKKYQTEKDKTIIIISHKLDPLKYCDKIILLKEGRIIDQLNYEDYKKRYLVIDEI